MTARELIVLSPYRVPAKDSLMLGDEDVAAFLNAAAALWYPLALAGAAGPPRVASPYDYETPGEGHVYAIPDSPPVFLPDDWDQRVIDVGAVAFRASADRETTLANLKEAFRAYHERTGTAAAPALFDLPPEQAAPFFGVGFGYLHLSALFEAMDHENVVAVTEFWQDVQQALAAVTQADAAACRAALQAAADRLLAGREALYPVAIHLVDICLLDEQPHEQPLPAGLDHGAAVNLVASGASLETFAHDHPEALARLRERVQAGAAEVCVGAYVEREDALLPLESQLWNLLKGLNAARDRLGADVQVYARKHGGAGPQLPLLLASAGLQRGLFLSFDDASLPAYRSTVVSWPTPDGRQVEVFARAPYKAESSQTYFHVAHYLNQTIAQDFAATLALVHRGKPAGPWYRDWLALSELAPVLGKWTTLSGYFNEVTSGEQASASSADEYHTDYLTERGDRHVEQPVSWFARRARLRRRVDTAYTLAGIYRGLVGTNDRVRPEKRLAGLEDALEQGEDREAELAEVQQAVGQALAERLLARAGGDNPGFLIVNPCSFTRRVALELDGITGTLAAEGPVKACQIDGGKARLVIEVPALGFAWVPRTGAAAPPAPAKRMRLADERHVRNEFFEASIDPATGGLRGLWDHRTLMSRVGQQLVYNPGSTMRASSVQVTSAGPALGEVVSEGAILDEHEQVLAKFRQRFRAWLGRPVLDLRIELYPEHAPVGYPWHAYYGARFAWRDERTLLLRGVNGTSAITSHTRPETPDYLEWRQGRQSTILFPGGLPFHQRHGPRMLDVILVPEGETCRTFDLALGLDREHPMQTALGMITPVAVVPAAKGPPHVGAAGWLFHLDVPNLLLTGLRPAADGDALTARLLECATYPTHGEFRCVRRPQRASLLNARGDYQSEASVQEDAAVFDVSASDFVQLRVEFS